MSPSSGSGIGYPIVIPPGAGYAVFHDILNGVQISLSLDRYQEIMRLPEAAFNGLKKDEDASCYDCAAIWKQIDREGLALAIAQAEEMRVRELNYYLSPIYKANEEHRFNDTGIFILEKKYLINVGVPVVEDVSLSQVIDLGVETDPYDPVTVIVPTTVTDPDEICIFHEGESYIINPTKVTISGGNATIYIPRSRLKKLDLDTNCDPPPDYYENDNFVTHIDVKRCYLDTTTGAWFVKTEDCGTLSEYTQTAYARIRDTRRSAVVLRPASYSSGVWTPVCFYKCPDLSRISYLSGIRSSIYTEKMTASLAHTLLKEIMPSTVTLCECWKDDMAMDENPLDTPYGNQNGAVRAWLADSRAKVGHGGKFPTVSRY